LAHDGKRPFIFVDFDWPKKYHWPKRIRDFAEAHVERTAQKFLQFDAEIAEKGPLWMETH